MHNHLSFGYFVISWFCLFACQFNGRLYNVWAQWFYKSPSCNSGHFSDCAPGLSLGYFSGLFWFPSALASSACFVFSLFPKISHQSLLPQSMSKVNSRECSPARGLAHPQRTERGLYHWEPVAVVSVSPCLESKQLFYWKRTKYYTPVCSMCQCL